MPVGWFTAPLWPATKAPQIGRRKRDKGKAKAARAARRRTRA